MKYEVTGKHTQIDGKDLPVGAVIEDDRDLPAIFPNKFRKVKGKAAASAKRVADMTPADLRAAADNDDRDDAVIDGGPTQPTPPDGSLDQNAKNSGTKEEEEEEGDDEPGAKSAAKAKAARKKKAKADGTEEVEYSDVTDQYPDAKKADLAVFEYADGGFQVFDGGDRDDPKAKPINDKDLKTSKQLDAFIKQYRSK